MSVAGVSDVRQLVAVHCAFPPLGSPWCTSKQPYVHVPGYPWTGSSDAVTGDADVRAAGCGRGGIPGGVLGGVLPVHWYCQGPTISIARPTVSP